MDGKLRPALGCGIALLLLCAAVAGPAQSDAGQDQGPRGQDERSGAQDQRSRGQDQSMETLKVNVNVVNLFFNVKDKHGLLIPNLTKDDFQIMEDGKPQTIKYFSAESNQPLTLGILIDSSVTRTP